MTEKVKRIGMYLLGGLITWGVGTGISNLLDGKTFFGNLKKPKDKTYIDWQGNVHLGTTDYAVR